MRLSVAALALRAAWQARALTGALLLFASTAYADAGIDEGAVLGADSKLVIDREETRVTGYAQRGRGYQSQEGPLSGPGSESLKVFQVQAEVEAHQGETITHRLTLPVDIVTSASANASDKYYAKPDMISAASAQNFSLDVDYELAVRTSQSERVNGGVGVHQEENFRSWLVSLAYLRSFAEDNATFGVSANEVFDWLDRYQLGGLRLGRTSRASSNLNLTFSQLLSPWTIASLDYGYTLQRGQLGNGWNTVPLTNGQRIIERLPNERSRHALSFALLEWLPWQGAARFSYRLYVDDWRALAHSVELALRQRLFPGLILGASYRYHRQRGIGFYTERGDANARYLSADSDLATLTSEDLGAELELSFNTPPFGVTFLQFGYDRYFRSNHLTVDVATCASGFRF